MGTLQEAEAFFWRRKNYSALSAALSELLVWWSFCFEMLGAALLGNQVHFSAVMHMESVFGNNCLASCAMNSWNTGPLAFSQYPISIRPFFFRLHWDHFSMIHCIHSSKQFFVVLFIFTEILHSTLHSFFNSFFSRSLNFSDRGETNAVNCKSVLEVNCHLVGSF